MTQDDAPLDAINPSCQSKRTLEIVLAQQAEGKRVEGKTSTSKSRRVRLAKWYLHMVLIHLSEFGAEAARGLVLPTLFTYAQELGGDLVFVGLLTSMFSVGRFFSSMLFGWLCDRVSFRVLYNLSGACAIVGNLLYILPYSPAIHSRALLAFSRFVVGFGAGNRSVCRANIAMLTRVEQRLQYFTLFATVVFLAYALTPALGGVVGKAEVELDSGYLVFNRLTAPGFLLIALNFVVVTFNNLVFDSSISREDAPCDEDENDSSAQTQVSEAPATLAAQIQDTAPSMTDRMATLGMLVFIFLNFNARGILSIFETVNVPLFLEITGRVTVESEEAVEATQATASFYLVIGLLGLVTYACIQSFRKRFSDVAFVIFGFAVLLVGNTILLLLNALDSAAIERADPEAYNVFVLAEVFVWSIGCPITSAVIVSAFSKVLGTRRQGFLMGIFGSSASIARTVLPLLPGLLSDWPALFAVNVALCMICIAVLVLYLHRLKKMRDEAYSTVATHTPTTPSAKEAIV